MDAEDPISSEVLPFDEAVRRIQKCRKRVSIHVGTFAQFTLQNPVDTVEGTVMGSHGLGALVDVTRKQAVEFLLDSFPKHWRPKLSLTIRTSKRCLFIGSSPR